VLRGLLYLTIELAKAVTEEVLTGVCEEEEDAKSVANPSNPKCCAIGEVLCNDAAKNDAESDTSLPSCKEGAIGCATLRIGSEVDEHRLEGWEHVSVAKTHDEGCSVEAQGIVKGCEKQIAEERDDNAVSGILSNSSLPQSSCSDKSA